MSKTPVQFDEIGDWSKLKLEIVEKYGSAYTRAFRKWPRIRKYYIDGFSGAGVHVSKDTKVHVEGSPSRALRISPSFDHF
jgi:three-Cys-motif partner protein